jgi:hypothetical protein
MHFAHEQLRFTIVVALLFPLRCLQSAPKLQERFLTSAFGAVSGTEAMSDSEVPSPRPAIAADVTAAVTATAASSVRGLVDSVTTVHECII